MASTTNNAVVLSRDAARQLAWVHRMIRNLAVIGGQKQFTPNGLVLRFAAGAAGGLHAPYLQYVFCAADGTIEVPTTPPEVTHCAIVAVGAGGAGGSSIATVTHNVLDSAGHTTVFTERRGGGGGGAGSTVIRRMPVDPGDSFQVVVGAGGAGADGEATTVTYDGDTIITAAGGKKPTSDAFGGHGGYNTIGGGASSIVDTLILSLPGGDGHCGQQCVTPAGPTQHAPGGRGGRAAIPMETTATHGYGDGGDGGDGTAGTVNAGAAGGDGIALFVFFAQKKV